MIHTGSLQMATEMQLGRTDVRHDVEVEVGC
uniref:Uncharacterized protein n=1 Tax=Arundo donax TaxID=35708 RepID=A0A0A9AAH6_ARUDO